MNNVMVAEMSQFGMIWPQCVARAWDDAQFREALKLNPAALLREMFQFILPEGVRLEVVEQGEAAQAGDAQTLRMVIPPAPEMELGEVALATSEAGKTSRHTFCFTSQVTFC